MKKRLFSFLLCLAVLAAAFPAFVTPPAAASDIPLGTYTNAEYSSSVTFNADFTFSFVMNFGEGFETVTGTYFTWEMDDGETVATLNVTSKHTGVVVYDTYNFSGTPLQDGQLYLTDGNAGIVPTETIFTLEDESGSSAVTDEQIAVGRASIAAAVKSNNEKLASAYKTAVASGHTYAGYRGAALDSWAVKEVGIADAMELMPIEVNDYFLEPITREDFSALVYSALLRLTGMTESQLQAAVTAGSFPDSSDSKVGVCAGLGIITGYETGKFLPENTITRQEAATMLSRLADTIGAEGTGSAISFSDITGLWSENYIKTVSALKDGYTGNAVMGGTGGNTFSPFNSYSREQAVMTIVRMTGVSAGGTGSTGTVIDADEGSYEAVSTDVEAKINALGADGTLSDDDVKDILDYAGTLEDQGLVTDVETFDNYVLYTTADGTPSGIVIDRETESEDGEATLGYGGAEPSVNNVSLLASDDDTLYLENNKVLFISSFSDKNFTHFDPMLDGIEALRDKGYDVTIQGNASLTQYAAIGSGDYSMIFINAHGAMLDDQFYICSNSDAQTAFAEEQLTVSGEVRIIDHLTLCESSFGQTYEFSRINYIAPAFFEEHLKSDPLDNAYVQFMCCWSMKNQSMADVFLANGAKAVSGYTDLVQVSYAADVLEQTAENLSPGTVTLDGTATTVGELKSNVLEKLGLHAFWTNGFNYYNTGTQTGTRRAVLTRFETAGADDMVLAVRNDSEDYGEGILIKNGTFTCERESEDPDSIFYNDYETKYYCTIVNNTNMTITGLVVGVQYDSMKQPDGGLYATPDVDWYETSNYGLPLKPGESTTVQHGVDSWWSMDKHYIVICIAAYTTLDIKPGVIYGDDIWTEIPGKDRELVRLVRTSPASD